MSSGAKYFQVLRQSLPGVLVREATKDWSYSQEDQHVINTVEVGNNAVVIDVYDVCRAFKVHDAALQHAIKKILCAGLRNKGSAVQDLTESLDAIKRGINNLDPSLDHNFKEEDDSDIPY